NGALELIGIIDVERTAAVEGHVVGDVNQRADRSEASGLQAVLHPRRRGAVLHALYKPASKYGTRACRLSCELEPDLNGACEGSLDGADLRLRLQSAQAGGGQITRDATYTRAVGPIRRELDLDDRIVEADDIDVPLAHALAEFRVELNDALVVVGQLQLALGDEHAVRDDAANGPLVQGDAGARDVRANRREHAN